MNPLYNSWDITIEVDNELHTPRYQLSQINHIQNQIESPYQDRYDTLEEAKIAYFKITGSVYKSAAFQFSEAINKGLFINNRYMVCDMPVLDVITRKHFATGISVSGEIVQLKWQEQGVHSLFESPEVEIINRAYAPTLDLAKQLPFESEEILTNLYSVSNDTDYYSKEETLLERRLYADCELYIVEKHIHEKVVSINESPSIVMESLSAPSAYRVQTIAAFKEVGPAISYVQHHYPDLQFRRIVDSIIHPKNIEKTNEIQKITSL